MSDETTDHDTDDPVLEAAKYENGAIAYPPHRLGPGGADRVGTVNLAEYEAEVFTWTESTATPPGVREPNTLAIVDFDLGDDYDGPPVRALGQIVADEDVEIGDTVEPVYAEELRDPEAGIREPDSQDWDGFRFRPVE
ncbi:hypothetical protein [Haloparvum sp. PAK95]|uniref:hypothetical protein n=1 Tax=Haloparvum sp. PAK95 TaxID=3418962 RepID=UPI003D2EF9A8